MRDHGWIVALLASVMLVSLAQAQENVARWAARFSNAWITYSSPALSLDGTTVYVGYEAATTGGIAALATGTGASRWVTKVTGAIDSSPVVAADGTVYVGSVNGTLYALRGATGDIRWEFNAGSFISSSPALGRDGTLYFGTGSGRLIAVSSTGQERWSFQTEDVILSSPAIGGDGTIYVGSSDRQVYALTKEGQLKWRFVTGGAVLGSPAIGWDGTVYIGSSDQTLYALNSNGTLKWSYLTNGIIDASPVLGADATVYFACGDAYFYALNPDGRNDQRLKWRTDMRAVSASTAAVRGDGVIIVGADDGIVRAFNPDDGRIRWTYQAEEEIFSSPTVGSDGAIYIGSLDGKLYKLAGNGSPQSTVSSWPSFHRDVGRNAQLPLTNVARLVNLSARVAAAAADTLIAGFFVQGGNGHPFLMRAVGPTLAQFGITDFMPDPRLDLYLDRRLERSNDNWEEQQLGINFGVADTAQGLEAFPLPAGSKDAAIVPTLMPGLYTTHVTSADGQGGVVLVEAYDARGSDPEARLVNLSVRSQVGVGERILIVGFVIDGSGPSRVLIRAVGPALTQFGVSNALAQPSMAVFRGAQQLKANVGWSSGGISYDLIGAAKTVAAFSLPLGSADAGLVLTLEPGPYTVQVSGVGSTTGEALAEVYVLP